MKTLIGSMFLFTMLLMSCSGGSDNGAGTPPTTGGGDDDPIAVPNPVAAILIFPENNTECTEGTPVSDTESDVNFQWNASENTDTYSITLTNLNTNESFTSDQGATERVIRLKRGTPYEWSVTSKADDTNTSATSEKWRFYNEGPGLQSYAPFPAEAIRPSVGATLATTQTITLEWSATDIDNDLEEYEVFLGTSENGMASLGVLATNSLGDISVIPGSTYFWQVKATDNRGNSSYSAVFDFTIAFDTTNDGGSDNDVQVPFAIVQVPPIYPGCESSPVEGLKECFSEKLQEHIAANFVYPQEAIDQGLEGRVNILFVIDTAGKVTDIRYRGPSQILEEAALEIIEKIPQMTPGMHDDEAVAVPYSLPITYKL